MSRLISELDIVLVSTMEVHDGKVSRTKQDKFQHESFKDKRKVGFLA